METRTINSTSHGHWSQPGSLLLLIAIAAMFPYVLPLFY